MKVHCIRSFLILLTAAFAGAISRADVPSAQADEVAHLISYLETSGCRMVRNGRSYTGRKGADHVRRKYDYFRDEISSTEEFVLYAATRSSVSGRDYEVQCPGSSPRSSKDWLLEELAAYRRARR